MSNEIDADFGRTFLFPPSLEDFVATDDPVRFIRAFVDSLDKDTLGIRSRRNETGRPEFSWRLLLRVWLYGWFERVHSTRELEKRCRRDVGMMWLTGLHCPDHNTIWRFYRDNKRALREVFRQSVRVAMMNDLVGMVLHALDGTKIRADASRYKELCRRRLEQRLGEVECAIEEALASMDLNEAQQGCAEHLPPELQDECRLRDKIRDDLVRLSESQRPNVNTTDPESRLMHTREGLEQYCYNAQGVVDGKSGIVVGAEVTQEETDHGQLNEQISGAEETTGHRAAQTVADSGYFSGAQLAEAEDRGRDVVVAIPDRYNENQYHSSDNPHHVNNYCYDAEQDCFVCPHGGRLSLRGPTGGEKVRYACESFGTCEHRSECTSSAHGKSITVSRYHQSICRQRDCRRQGQRQAVLRRRGGIVEPVFGFIKQVFGLRRFRGRGLVNASTQWYLACCIHNLRKLYRYYGVGVRFA